MTNERTRQTDPNETRDRTGKYGGDDGALEHEREEIEPGEDSGITGTPVPTKQSQSPADQAERQRRRDLETGADGTAAQSSVFSS